MRLIDADILIAELKESAFHHCNNPREDSLLQRDRVIVRAQPTVEAIPKDQYETRLKADMVAMLEELLAELKELPKACFYEENEFGDVTGCINYPAISKNALDLIDQKINELKEQRDETV